MAASYDWFSRLKCLPYPGQVGSNSKQHHYEAGSGYLYTFVVRTQYKHPSDQVTMTICKNHQDLMSFGRK